MGIKAPLAGQLHRCCLWMGVEEVGTPPHAELCSVPRHFTNPTRIEKTCIGWWHRPSNYHSVPDSSSDFKHDPNSHLDEINGDIEILENMRQRKGTGCLITFYKVSFSQAVKEVWALFFQRIKCLNRVADVKIMNNSSPRTSYLGHGHLLSQDDYDSPW